MSINNTARDHLTHWSDGGREIAFLCTFLSPDFQRKNLFFYDIVHKRELCYTFPNRDHYDIFVNPPPLLAFVTARVRKGVRVYPCVLCVCGKLMKDKRDYRITLSSN